MADVDSLARLSGVTIDSQLEPVTIAGDPDELRVAVTNVLTNAVRYNSTPGHVRVQLATRDRARELTVADSGIGIDSADLPRVFDPFFRGDPARSRDTGGAGLGLAVARAIVTRHGGTIACESAPGAGTRVTMTWSEAT